MMARRCGRYWLLVGLETYHRDAPVALRFDLIILIFACPSANCIPIISFIFIGVVNDAVLSSSYSRSHFLLPNKLSSQSNSVDLWPI